MLLCAASAGDARKRAGGTAGARRRPRSLPRRHRRRTPIHERGKGPAECGPYRSGRLEPHRRAADGFVGRLQAGLPGSCRRVHGLRTRAARAPRPLLGGALVPEQVNRPRAPRVRLALSSAAGSSRRLGVRRARLLPPGCCARLLLRVPLLADLPAIGAPKRQRARRHLRWGGQYHFSTWVFRVVPSFQPAGWGSQAGTSYICRAAFRPIGLAAECSIGSFFMSCPC